MMFSALDTVRINYIDASMNVAFSLTTTTSTLYVPPVYSQKNYFAFTSSEFLNLDIYLLDWNNLNFSI